MSHRKDFQFGCQVCGKLYQYPSELRRHELSHRSEKMARTKPSKKRGSHRCEECDKKFNSKDALTHHNKYALTHDRRCGVCDLEFENGEGYTQHINNEHVKDDSFWCRDCDRYFPSSSIIRRHFVSHRRREVAPLVAPEVTKHDRPFSCIFCELTFPQRKELAVHIQKHHYRKAACEICDTQFDSPIKLQQHIDTIHAAKIFKCDLCHRAFQEQKNYELHFGGYCNNL